MLESNIKTIIMVTMTRLEIHFISYELKCIENAENKIKLSWKTDMIYKIRTK